MVDPLDSVSESSITSASSNTAAIDARMLTRFAGGLFWGQLLRLVEVGTSLIFLVIVVRKLGPAQYGVFGLLINICALGTLVSGQGFGDMLSKYLPQIQARSGAQASARLAKQVIVWSILLTAAIAIALWLLRYELALWFHNNQILTYAYALLLLFAGQSISNAFSASNVALLKINGVCIVVGMINVLALAGAIVGISIYRPSAGIMIGASAIAYTAGIIGYLIVSRQWLFIPTADHGISMREIWRFSSRAWLVKLATFAVSGEIIVLLMGWWVGQPRDIGYFNAAYVPLARLQILLLGWTLPVLPSLSELHATRGVNSLSGAYRLYIKLLVAIIVPIFAFVALHARTIVSSLFTDSFLPAASLLRIYASLWIVAILFGSGLTTSLLYSLNKPTTVVKIRILVAAACLPMAYLLIPRFGSLGAVLSVGLSAMAMAICEMLVVRRTIAINYPFGFVVKVLAASAISLAITYLLRPATLISLVLCGILLLVVYILSMSRLKVLDAAEKDTLNKHPVLARVLAYF